MAGGSGDQDTKRSVFWSWLKYEDEDTEMSRHMRETLLIVAALITAVTFQAGVNPPGGVWQETKDNHTAGCAVYAEQEGPFFTFLTFNTLALSTSILLLIFLTFKFRFRFEVLVATLSMFATYASSIFAIAPDHSVRYRYLLITAASPLLSGPSSRFSNFSRRRVLQKMPCHIESVPKVPSSVLNNYQNLVLHAYADADAGLINKLHK